MNLKSVIKANRGIVESLGGELRPCINVNKSQRFDESVDFAKVRGNLLSVETLKNIGDILKFVRTVGEASALELMQIARTRPVYIEIANVIQQHYGRALASGGENFLNLGEKYLEGYIELGRTVLAVEGVPGKLATGEKSTGKSGVSVDSSFMKDIEAVLRKNNFTRYDTIEIAPMGGGGSIDYYYTGPGGDIRIGFGN